MDIIVEGTKSKSYKPNEVNINLTFTYVDNKYDTCLEEGLNLIEDFVFNTSFFASYNYFKPNVIMYFGPFLILDISSIKFAIISTL